MGVVILQAVPIEKSGALTTEHLSKRIVELGATQAGHFLVDCDAFVISSQMQTQMGPGQQMKTVYVMHNSEQPASVFSILDSGQKQIPVVADALFDLISVKITNTLNPKKQPKIESKGPRFELGDFLIKLGSVTIGQNFKGILVEVEYRPCLIPSQCWELIKEFLQGFLGPNVPAAIPQYFNAMSVMNQTHSKANDIYQPLDTIQQYLEHFTNYRKQSSLWIKRF